MINFIVSENVIFLSVIRVVVLGFMYKYVEGWLKQRYYQGCKYVDEVEFIGVEFFIKFFGSDFVDLRLIFGINVNQVVFFGFIQLGDKVIVFYISYGGYISYMFFGVVGMRGFEVYIWFFDNEEFNIDVDKVEKFICEVEFKIVVFGGLFFLFLYFVKEFVLVVKEVGVYVMYDGVYVFGFIVGKQFQDLFCEGVDIIMVLIYKIFFGLQGGVIIYKCFGEMEEIVKFQWVIFLGVFSNYYFYYMVGKVIIVVEMFEYGEKYVVQIVKNVKVFVEVLVEEGFKVIGEDKGYIESYQVIVDVLDFYFVVGGWVVLLFEEVGIIFNKNFFLWDLFEKVNELSGFRIGVQEMIRVGMMEDEMKEIVRFIRCVFIDKEDFVKVRRDVYGFCVEYQKVYYFFDYGFLFRFRE